MHKTINRLIALVFILIMNPCAAASGEEGKTLKRIPDVFVDISEDQGPGYAIVVEKNNQQLSLYSYDGAYRRIFRMTCSTGENVGAKTRSGDRKTPEGVYFFTKEHKKRDLAPMYGSMAFPTDYPNLPDRLTGKGGNAIWLHGTNKSLKPRDTNGCVALENPNIERLKKYISLNRTPIIIVDKLSYVPVASISETKRSILQFISRWKDALSSGSYHEYLSFYDPDYLPDISWWTEWNRVRKGFQRSNQSLFARATGISIYKHQGTYVILFDQHVGFSNEEVEAGVKKLYISDKGDQLKITAEEYQASPDRLKQYRKKNPIIVAGHNLESLQKGDSEIVDLVEDWLKAWSSKDIKRYASYYAKNFRSQGGAGLNEWLRYKNRLNSKYRYIRVTQENLVVKKGMKRSTASFLQKYKSNRFKSEGLKKLVFIREGGGWKIYREIAK